jgi:cytochrome P450
METMEKLPPGPTALAVAQLVELSTNPYAFYERCRARHGDVFTIRLPGQSPVVVVAEPEGVRSLVTGGYADLIRHAEGIRFLLGDHSVLFQQDDPHKETRKLLMPPFQGERMRAYGADMARIADEVIAPYRDGERRLFHHDMQDVTLRVILRCVFGITEEGRIRELGEHLIAYLEALMTPWFFGATRILTARRVRALIRSRGEAVRQGRRGVSRLPLQSAADRLGAADAIMFDEIARCRRLPEAERAARADILSMLAGARFEDGSALSDEALRDHLMTLLVGGHETTATALAWTLHDALSTPGTIERMRAEVSGVMGSGFDPTRVRQLSYVGAVASESMRLHPIATMIPRKLKHEATLGGHRLPAGTLVSPALYLVQRDPRVWEDPLAFRPERFLSGKPSIYEYFPFGAGVWRCLGAHFAEYEMRVVLARLVAQVDFDPDPTVYVRPKQRGFTVAPSDGMPVFVRRRPENKRPPAREIHEAQA